MEINTYYENYEYIVGKKEFRKLYCKKKKKSQNNKINLLFVEFLQLFYQESTKYFL